MTSSRRPAGESTGRHIADPGASPDTGMPAEAAAEGGALRADAETGPPDDIQELQRDIEQTREQLGQTVEQLAAKADVKSHAQAKTAALAGQVKTKTAQARTKAAAAGSRVQTEVQERATPVWQATPEPLRRAAAKGASTARQRRVPLAVASAALIAGGLALLWWRKR